jgi:hypothetical protein
MNTAQMLHLATQEALKGDWVMVSCFTESHATDLIRQLTEAIPKDMVKGSSRNPCRIDLGQGHIQFVKTDNLERSCRGKRGDVFILDTKEGTWTQEDRFRFVRKEVPNRFARILAEG